jgi:hypothetical protein
LATRSLKITFGRWLPAMRREAEARETEDHHCPCGGFGYVGYGDKAALQTRGRIDIEPGYLTWIVHPRDLADAQTTCRSERVVEEW